MARQITDAQRQVTVPFPAKRVNWKRLMVWLIVACVVAGGSVGGYYLYDYVTTSTAIQPPSVVQPPVVVPATPTENPTSVQPETPMPVLEVAWEEVKLPPLESGYDGIDVFSVEDAKTISVYRMIGSAKNGEETLYGLWKTTDGGKTWNETKRVISDQNQGKVDQLELPPVFWPGDLTDPYNPYRRLKESLEKITSSFPPYPYRMAQNPNNPNDVFLLCQPYQLFLFSEGLWYQVNFPPNQLVYYNDSPNDPGRPPIASIPEPVVIGIISTDDGSIKLFITMPKWEAEKAVLWTTTVNTIKSPN